MEGFEIQISNGKITIEAKGFFGEVCITETEKIIKLLEQLGIEVNLEELQKKPEFFMSVGTTSKNKIDV